MKENFFVRKMFHKEPNEYWLLVVFGAVDAFIRVSFEPTVGFKIPVIQWIAI